MQGQRLDSAGTAMTRDDGARGWTVQQTMMDWALRKSVGALVSMEFHQALLWNELRNSAPARLRNGR